MALKMLIIIAITAALTLALIATTNLGNSNVATKLTIISEASKRDEMIISSFPSMKDLNMVKSRKRVSRFLAEKERNPRAADHCMKDNDVCYSKEFGQNSTCCNNKCMDLSTDSKNCGACKNKCKYTESCCGGECVNLAYDKSNCGKCGKECPTSSTHLGICLYGVCDYA